MKNIHVLPTEKPSRLYLFEKILKLGGLTTVVFKNSGAVNQHIYITSDEEIKEGDWVIQINYEKTNVNLIKCVTEAQTKIANDKNGSFIKNKIILTTDPKLIKDGVQAIDDKFLEWFVKNPSCEGVEVKLENYYASGALQPNLWQHKIIIPKEEPKQDLPQLGTKEFNDLASAYFGGKPKQETLEEVAEKLTNDFPVLEVRFNMSNEEIYGWFLEALQKGAKWQQERSYSEEEVLQILYKHTEDLLAGKKITLEEWFNQVKKK